MLGRVAMALETDEVTAVARALWERQLWGASVPRVVSVNSRRTRPSADWIDRYAETGDTIGARFDAEGRYYLIMHTGESVNAAFEFEGGPTELVDLLSRLPFRVASFETRYDEWRTRGGLYPDAPGFGGHHFSHGWACAFQGLGHRRLVSRRWLQQDCWRLHHGPNDTTLVQFHDLDLAAAAALKQARPAHRRMGITHEGGFLQEPYFYANDIRGFYDAERRVLEIVILGRTVVPVELRDASAARHDQVLGPDQPIDNVAFVFLDPTEARAHLPRLWPYELECWTIIDEVKTRLDSEEPPEGANAWTSADDMTRIGAETPFLKSMRELSALHSAHHDDPQRLREAAAAIVAKWSEPTGSARSATDIADRLGSISATDRELLGEGLRVITEWVRQPSEETGRRVDAVIARMRRELGPLIEPDPHDRQAADQESLRASVRESIARRLRETRVRQQPDSNGSGETVR